MTKGALEVALVRAQADLREHEKQAAVYAQQLAKLDDRVGELEGRVRCAHGDRNEAQNELIRSREEFNTQMTRLRKENDAFAGMLSQSEEDLVELSEQMIADGRVARARENILKRLMDAMVEEVLDSVAIVTPDGKVYPEEG